MGKVWLQTTDGKLIHLPVQGADVNTPDNPQRIPTSLVTVQDRCYSQPITIISPTYGTFIIDFIAESGLTGSCNQCGQCCGHPAGDCQWGSLEACGYVLHPDLNWHVCQHLSIKNWRKWGDPDNTTCLVYETLLDTFKGCVYPPLHLKPWMTSCGYSVA